MPSLRPLSTLIKRRMRSGTTGSDIIEAPSAASVGASAAPTNTAAQPLTPGRRPAASSAPSPMHKGNPINRSLR